MLHCVTKLGVMRHYLSTNIIYCCVDPSSPIACNVVQANILRLVAVAMAEKVQLMFYRWGESKPRYGQLCSHLSSNENAKISLARFEPSGSLATAMTPSTSLMKSSITGARTRSSAKRWYKEDKRSGNSAGWTVFRTFFSGPTKSNYDLFLRHENPRYAPISLART